MILVPENSMTLTPNRGVYEQKINDIIWFNWSHTISIFRSNLLYKYGSYYHMGWYLRGAMIDNWWGRMGWLIIIRPFCYCGCGWSIQTVAANDRILNKNLNFPPLLRKTLHFPALIGSAFSSALNAFSFTLVCTLFERSRVPK